MTTAPAAWAARLEATALAEWVRAEPWAYPSLEVVHLLGLALLFGTIFLVDLRLLGFARALEPRALATAALPWTRVGFAVAVAAGLLLFTARPTDFLANPAFLVKLGLIGAALANVAVLHARGPLAPSSMLTRVQAAASLLLWAGAIACGRWIAYV